MDDIALAVQTTDPRIKNLSYSSLLTLHTCPRKYQLYKLGATQIEPPNRNGNLQSVTFAVGHIIGTGIQNILSGMTQEEVIFAAFIQWYPDLYDANPKQNKSFFGCIHALNQFRSLYESEFFSEYELVSYAGKPACELSFSIELHDDFYYRGFVDAVLRHKLTGKIVVLECKTTAEASVNPAQYKNSAQAIGYSIVLDHMFPDIASYEVLYLVYQTKSERYTPIPYEKSYYQRALWIRELLLDIETIKAYENAGIYPMHGESCYSFFRECEYITTCTLSTAVLTERLSPAQLVELEAVRSEYQIRISLNDLITSQLSKESMQQNEPTIPIRPAGSSSTDFTDDIFL